MGVLGLVVAEALGRVPTATVVFERNGERQVVQDAYADAEIMRPMPWLERKLFSYRVVDPDGMPARCRW